MIRAISRLLPAAALLSGALLGIYAAGPAIGAGPVRPLAVVADPLPLNPKDPGAGRVGRLRYLGGLALRAGDKGFGGISGMVFDAACGRLLAVTDAGSWIALEPVEEEGRLLDIRGGWIAPIRNPEGQPPVSKAAADAEEVALVASGDLYVAYEQRHRIEQFQGVSACRPETLARPPIASHRIAEMADWPANGGAEAMAALGDELLLLSEAVPAGQDRRLGLRVRPGEAARTFSWKLPADGYQPTAMELFEGGDGQVHLLVLHRKASILDGLSAALGEAVLDPETGLPGAGRTVARLRPPLTVDNMEAMAVRPDSGRIFVYLASDDNFNRLQRTLLLKFELLPEGP